MLDYAQKRAVEALQIPHRIVLATNGPAGLLASEFPCEAVGLHLYLLVPKTCDHLFNLEHDPGVSLVTTGWELKGIAQILAPVGAGLELDLLRNPAVEWCQLVRVDPEQIQFQREVGWGNLETIDLP
jgi:hypothetical protein